MSAPLKYSEEDVTAGLMSMVAWAGNATNAARALRAEGREIKADTLSRWTRETFAGRYHDMREKYADQLEAQLIGEFREVARLATDVQRLALDRATQKLLSDNDHNPGRTAADAAAVARSMTDKMLSLSGRPTQIREDRNLNEIMRSLVAKGILQMPDEPVEIPASVDA